MSDIEAFEAFFPAIKAALATGLALLTAVVFWTIGPNIETRYFPVLDKLQIVSIGSVSPTMSEIQVTFTKRRNCEYVGMSWYYRDPVTGIERVALIQGKAPGDETPPNRPLGFQRAGPWKVGIAAGELKGKSFVQAFHFCHGLWTTRTEFYP